MRGALIDVTRLKTAEALPRIFDKFERAISARHFGGLGLGLFIVLVELPLGSPAS